jgi:hypothetical protein
MFFTVASSLIHVQSATIKRSISSFNPTIPTFILMTHKKKWLLFAPSGLMIIGFGTCLIQWATALQRKQVPTGEWVAAGTLALGVFNAGLCVFGRGVAEGVLHEIREKGPSAIVASEVPQE